MTPDTPARDARLWPGVRLTLSAAGSGAGVIVMSPADTMCRTACVTSFPPGQRVTLGVLAQIGSAFAGWSGDPDCLDGLVSMDVDRTCVATFVTVLTTMARPRSLDLNGDGAGDAFTYDPATGAWSMEFGDRAGRFGSVRGTWSPGWQIFPAEFNDDWLADFLLYSRGTSGVPGAPAAGQWMRVINTGNGDFLYASGTWWPGWRAQVIDLNGDGRSDVFLYDPSSGTWFKCLTSHPLGEFSYERGFWSPGWEVSAADWNGDGLADLFLRNPSTRQWFRVLNDGATFAYESGTVASDGEVYAADVSGDGRTDLVVYDAASGRWSLAVNDGRGFTYSAGVWPPRSTVRIGDFDGDGRDDAFVYEGRSGLWIEALSNGAGGFTDHTGAWSPAWQVAATDLDGDRREDVLLYNETTGQWFQAINTGPASFSYQSGIWAARLAILAQHTYR